LALVVVRGFAPLLAAAALRKELADDFRAEAAVEDFAREPLAALAAPPRLPVERLAVERLAPPREPADLFAPPPPDDEEPELVLALASTDQLPDMMRCAASATASAISEPSLVALATMLLAA
jgi:hypothetical protein